MHRAWALRLGYALLTLGLVPGCDGAPGDAPDRGPNAVADTSSPNPDGAADGDAEPDRATPDASPPDAAQADASPIDATAPDAAPLPGEDDCRPPPARLWQLTPDQLAATIDQAVPSHRLATDDLRRALARSAVGGEPFYADPDLLNASPGYLAELAAGITELAAALAADPAGFDPCLADAPDADCVRDTIERIGRRAWRRPLTADEVDRQHAFYDAMVAAHGPALGLQSLVERLLSAPEVLFRSEQGVLDPESGLQTLTAYERADLIAYTITDLPPDDALAAAADDGSLLDPAVAEAHVRRLLDTPPDADDIISDTTGEFQQVRGVLRFFREWLRADEIRLLSRPAFRRYPNIANEERILRWLDNETMMFARHVVWVGDGRLETLLGADYQVVDGSRTLTKFYGHNDGQTPPAEPTAPARHGRRGALMLAGFLARHDGATDRGLFIRARLLCQDITAPPTVDMNLEGLEQALEEAEEVDLSPREVRARHLADPACSGCHTLIDPLGFPFDGFDDGGVPRDDWHGFPIDTAGRIEGSEGIDGEVADASELMARLSTAAEVRRCFVEQLFTYVHGRAPTLEDRCYLDRLTAGFEASDGDIKALLVDLLTGDEMQRRTPPRGG